MLPPNSKERDTAHDAFQHEHHYKIVESLASPPQIASSKPSGLSKDRWLVSYADFMTLLCAFFIMLYSIELLDDDKIEHIQEHIERVFKPYENLDATPYDELIDKDEQEIDQTNVMGYLQGALLSYIESNDLSLQENEHSYIIQMNNRSVFTKEPSYMSNRGLALITDIAEGIKSYPNPVKVLGHSSDKAINDPRFSNHWQLSSYYASEVANQLVKLGVAPQRIKLSAFSYYQSDNLSSQSFDSIELAEKDPYIEIILYKDLNEAYWRY